MIGNFLHFKIVELEKLMNEQIKVYQSYSSNAFGFEREADELIEKTFHYYHAQNQINQANAIQGLISKLFTVRRGIHPISLEKITKDRRQTMLSFYFDVLHELEAIINENHKKIEDKLEQSQAMLKQILLSGIQLNVISESDLGDFRQNQQTEPIWDKFDSEPSLKLYKKKILLDISKQDALILLFEILNQILNF
jgi:hypothetical protein